MALRVDAAVVACFAMMPPRDVLFDTHVHLDCDPLRGLLAAELVFARRAGIQHFMVPGVAPADWTGLLQTVQEVPGALAALGVHPLKAEEWTPAVTHRLEGLLALAAAVGEIGLDGSPGAPPAVLQEELFRIQLRLAIGLRKPVLIHCRKALGRVLALLREEGAQRVGGILHAFSGSIEVAKEAIRLNFALGIGGSITYVGARRGPAMVSALPQEWLVLETDAPDLAPVPHRGEVNRPGYLPLIAERVAELKGWTYAETARITTSNARRVLQLST